MPFLSSHGIGYGQGPPFEGERSRGIVGAHDCACAPSSRTDIGAAARETAPILSMRRRLSEIRDRRSSIAMLSRSNRNAICFLLLPRPPERRGRSQFSNSHFPAQAFCLPNYILHGALVCLDRRVDTISALLHEFANCENRYHCFIVWHVTS